MVALIGVYIGIISTFTTSTLKTPNIELQVRAEIIQQAHGKVDVETALRIAKCESNFDPLAKNKVSSAKGVYQFIDKTFSNYCTGDVYNTVDNIRCFVDMYPKHPEWWECK